jgi:heptosyltransferase-3
VRVRGNPVLRHLDRLVGIPLVSSLALQPKRAKPAVIQRIGLVRTAAIGDTLLVSGVLRDIRAALPNADVVLVTGEDNAEAGRLSAGDAARVIEISVKAPIDAIMTLRREHFDVLIDGGQWPRIDALLVALSGARYRVGFRTANQHRHHGFDIAVEHSSTVHELDNFRALVAAAGIRSTAAPRIDRRALPPAPSVASGPHLVFHPWSGGFRGEIKEWPADRWTQLAVQLRDLNARVLITGSPPHRIDSENLARQLTGAGCDAVSVAGELSFTHLAAVVAASRVVVSVNTGVMHLAAILGVPTVALDGPTPPLRWGPIGPRAVSVTPDVAGCGYLDLGSEYDGQRLDCMAHIPIDAVERAVRKLLSS